MIILPERNIPRGRVLLPQRAAEWRQPSQRRVIYGIENQTRWRLTARAHDGAIIWRGWFDDRDDADAFLHAIVAGTISQDRALWDLPAPMWPGLPQGLNYEIHCISFLTSPTGSNQTYSVPSDWNSSDNIVETLGAGGGGGGCNNANGGGGGGGAYSAQTNISLTPGGSATWRVGTAGTTGAGAAGGDGGDSWFNGTTLGGSSVGSKGGVGGGLGSGGSGTGGSGGASGSGTGATKYSGGNGATGSGGAYGGGAGGAAGPAGAGGNASTSNGGTGNNGTDGAGGTGNGGNGGNGTVFDASHGSGGGGAGRTTNSATLPGNGGTYGAGGGGPRSSGIVAGGAAYQGLIAITYTPLTVFAFGKLKFP